MMHINSSLPLSTYLSLKWAVLDPHVMLYHSMCVRSVIGNMPFRRTPRWLCGSAVLKIIGIITDTLTNNLQRKSEYCWAHSSERDKHWRVRSISPRSIFVELCWNQRQCRDNHLLISTNILHASRFTSRRSIIPGESYPLTLPFIIPFSCAAYG